MNTSRTVTSYTSKIGRRWTPRLGEHFCPVSSYFLANYHRLGGASQRGLNATEALLVIHIMDYKWDDAMPFPTVGKLAERMGISRRHVRDTLRGLEQRGVIARIPGARGGANRYNLDGLMTALETLMAEDADKREQPVAA